MAIKMLRGTVNNFTRLDKHGAANCRIHGYNLKVSRDLSSLMREGDDVLVAGIERNNVLYPMAVKNFRKDKSARVDATNYVLLMALGGFLGVLCGVLGLQAIGSGEILFESIDDMISIAGFIAMVLAIRHILLINKASNQVNYPGI